MHREERRRHATKPHQRTTSAVFARATLAVRQSQRLFQSRTRLATYRQSVQTPHRRPVRVTPMSRRREAPRYEPLLQVSCDTYKLRFRR
ncbi:hypothetical protein IG631_08364 [Alternaria alternata]|nr:hypothetical protein IG631_08364 [Alternaria alternata]